MLKTTGSSDMAPRKLRTDKVVGGSDRVDEMIIDLSKLSKVEELSKVQ